MTYFLIADTVCETEFATNMTFKVVTAILNFYIPTTIMTFLYVRIFLAIKQRSRDIVRFGAYTSSGLTTVNGSRKKEPQSIEEKRVNFEAEKISEVAKAEEVVESIANNAKHQEKIEFHRLALVALPIDNAYRVTANRVRQNSLKGMQQNTIRPFSSLATQEIMKALVISGAQSNFLTFCSFIHLAKLKLVAFIFLFSVSVVVHQLKSWRLYKQ